MRNLIFGLLAAAVVIMAIALLDKPREKTLDELLPPAPQTAPR